MSLYTQARRIVRLLKNRHYYFCLEEELRQSKKDLEAFKNIAPIGFYESPYPSEEELEKGYAKGLETELLGVDLNQSAQLELYEKLLPLASASPMSDKEKNSKFRFYDFGDNVWFGRDDGRWLYAMLMYFRPKNILEIGSGFSTALMLDVNEILKHSMHLFCIEPRATRLKALLKTSDNLKIIEKDCQEIELSVFEELGGGYAIYR